jgi:hypothetical protein
MSWREEPREVQRRSVLAGILLLALVMAVAASLGLGLHLTELPGVHDDARAGEAEHSPTHWKERIDALLSEARATLCSCGTVVLWGI